MTANSAIYTGDVVHVRYRPKHHRLHYRVFSMLIDLDDLPALDRDLRLFGFNRWGVLAFHEADHGDGKEGGLRAWVEQQLAAAGVMIDRPRIRILCYPRVLGYVFNPLTEIFCHDRDGTLRAILHQVTNTFGERRTYVIPVSAGMDANEAIRQACRKELYVSPFVGMDVRYEFLIRPPGERVLVRVDDVDAEGLLIRATFAGRRRELTDAALMRLLLRYPLMTLKVIAGIHWEALRLWRKGLPVFRHRPAPARNTVAIVARGSSTGASPHHAARDREPEPVGE